MSQLFAIFANTKIDNYIPLIEKNSKKEITKFRNKKKIKKIFYIYYVTENM